MNPELTPIETETDAALRLDTALIGSGLFHVYSEVTGVLMQPQVAQANESVHRCRINRVLIPARKLIDAGWDHGAVGIEIKSSEMSNDGKVLSQVLDYRRCAWTLPSQHGSVRVWLDWIFIFPNRRCAWTLPSQHGSVRVWLDWIFIFPMRKEHGSLASLMAHNRFGTANSSQYVWLHLQCGEETVLRIGHDGEIRIGRNHSGRKVGSR